MGNILSLPLRGSFHLNLHTSLGAYKIIMYHLLWVTLPNVVLNFIILNALLALPILCNSSISLYMYTNYHFATIIVQSLC